MQLPVHPSFDVELEMEKETMMDKHGDKEEEWEAKLEEGETDPNKVTKDTKSDESIPVTQEESQI